MARDLPYVSLFPLSSKNRKNKRHLSPEARRLRIAHTHEYYMGEPMAVSDFLALQPTPDEDGFCLNLKIFYQDGKHCYVFLYLRKLEDGYVAYSHIDECENLVPAPTIEAAIVASGKLPFNLRDRCA